MNVRTPITVITGFLGAGKTTILANLIKATDGVHFAVIVNEFGEASIDGTILREQANSTSAEFHDIKNALIAYAPDDDFAKTMQALAERSDIDHILIETSGLAVPTAVMERLQSPQLVPRFVLDATLLVVDTPLFLEDKFSSPTTGESIQQIFLSQLQCADVVVLNKIDYLPEDSLLQAEERIQSLSPTVRFLELAYEARLDRRVALGLRLNERTDNTFDSRIPHSNRVPRHVISANDHEHSGLGKHEHGILSHEHIHEHDVGWISFLLRTNEWQEPDNLKEGLHFICESEPVLRLKGTTRRRETGKQLLFQGVRQRIEVTDLTPSIEPDHPAPHHSLHSHEPEHHSGHQHHHAQPDQKHHACSVDHSHNHDKSHVKQREHGHTRTPNGETDHHLENTLDEHGIHQGWLDAETKGEMVFIGYHLNREAVLHKLREHTHTVWY